jgi:hypothetical protein
MQFFNLISYRKEALQFDTKKVKINKAFTFNTTTSFKVLIPAQNHVFLYLITEHVYNSSAIGK